MIDCDNLQDNLRQKLKTLAVGDAWEIKTYKGDRRIVITKTAADGFLVEEDGFVQAVYRDLDSDKLKKLVKTLQKREFPRSNKLRTRMISGADHD